ncbi:uncharacterized protein L969DRAFT_15144 [Mixia osmundae IAM 14324]|uniref:Uncharacterized protein n=1 Tax=Mixia osmundae (strain CBS 9802 / IAM 14324 / JCM 22182 / KY 12970) TaxID=764103 RepID=G7DXS7_MIXOS|nr:uncharacterized protein L969DRAFT_15144 [Mixia osmundae IAM 14324]KEI41126.1 hypothetical protein L969DRAFT_15144 [Mixia osmundae IAM 14324]GAA95387.1 hypothetical protein E5Q_02041 [Mixia osmundae IAM 14324]
MVGRRGIRPGRTAASKGKSKARPSASHGQPRTRHATVSSDNDAPDDVGTAYESTEDNGEEEDVVGLPGEIWSLIFDHIWDEDVHPEDDLLFYRNRLSTPQDHAQLNVLSVLNSALTYTARRSFLRTFGINYTPPSSEALLQLLKTPEGHYLSTANVTQLRLEPARTSRSELSTYIRRVQIEKRRFTSFLHMLCPQTADLDDQVHRSGRIRKLVMTGRPLSDLQVPPVFRLLSAKSLHFNINKGDPGLLTLLNYLCHFEAQPTEPLENDAEPGARHFDKSKDGRLADVMSDYGDRCDPSVLEELTITAWNVWKIERELGDFLCKSRIRPLRLQLKRISLEFDGQLDGEQSTEEGSIVRYLLGLLLYHSRDTLEELRIEACTTTVLDIAAACLQLCHSSLRAIQLERKLERQGYIDYPGYRAGTYYTMGYKDWSRIQGGVPHLQRVILRNLTLPTGFKTLFDVSNLQTPGVLRERK